MREKKYALKNISFEVDKGESIGIIGVNGSGKSTLLKILCGITAQTEGEFKTEGKISALLELGTGFNPEYNGISNIYLNGAIQGLTKSETRALIPKICEFADIGEYINMPVKTYSDGMYLRLAFACAVAVKPDILVIDEALAVGDFSFRQKCFKKITELKESGTTLLMVSHDIDIIRRFCNRAIWLENGEIRQIGDVSGVSSAYMESVTGGVNNISFNIKDEKTNRFGSNTGAVISADIPPCTEYGRDCEIRINIDIPPSADLKNTALSVSFKNEYGLDLTVFSTADQKIKFTDFGKQTVIFKFPCLLCGGKYSAAISLENRGDTPITYYDYIENAAEFEVLADKERFGIFGTNAEAEIIRG